VANTATSYGGGIYIDSSSSANVTNCSFSQNTAAGGGGGGLYIGTASSANVTNSTFSFNSGDDGGGKKYF